MGILIVKLARGVPVTNFIQQQVNGTQVSFVQDGSCAAPTYQVSVTDGLSLPSLPLMPIVTFNPIRPSIMTNYLKINPGEAVTLTSDNLNTIDSGDIVANLYYTISSVQHGQLSLINSPAVPIIQFTQQQINDGSIQFVSDSTGFAPRYTVFVQDSCGLKSDSSTANINFHLIPKLGNNQLVINQGQTIKLTSDNLNATNLNDISKSSSLQFTVGNVQHGHFEALDNLGTVINSFYQENITTGNVEFIHDGSIQTPSFDTSVSDGILSSASSSALITFNPNTPLAEDASDNTVRNSIIGGCISGGFGIFFLFLKIYLEKKANEYINKEIRSDEFREKVVILIAQ